MLKTTRTVIILLCFLGTFWSFRAKPALGKISHTKTHKSYQSLSEENFREAFQQYLCRRLGKERSDVIVSKLKVRGNKPVPAGKADLQLFQKGKRRLVGHVKLAAVIIVNEKTANKVVLSGWVDVFGPVLCASGNLKRGEILKKDDVYITRKNISHLKPSFLTDPHKAVGLILKHNVKADATIKAWMLKRTPIVDKGDLVTILAESAGLRLTVPGQVLMEGFEGELVKVKNLMSKKDIYAKIVDNSTVMVDF